MAHPQVEPRTETLPYSWYADPAVAAWSASRSSGARGSTSATSGELDGPGSMFPTQVGGLPLVVVLDGDERAARVPERVPPPRHASLVDEPQKRGTIQCPYHAWTYGLDGSLRGAPRSKDEPDFDTDCLGLRAAQVGTWGPFVFANPDLDAPGLDVALGDLPEVVAENGLDVDSLALPRPRRLRDQRELEDRDRELPRVLPLPAEPPGLREADRRASGSGWRRSGCASASSRRCTPTPTRTRLPTT